MRLWLTGVDATPSAATWHLIDFAYCLNICLDFPFTLLSYWPKQHYSWTNKSNTYTEGHATSVVLVKGFSLKVSGVYGDNE